MTLVGTDNGELAGCGSVDGRYLRRRVQGTPTIDDIPSGCWAEKRRDSELWDIKRPEATE